MGRYLPYLGILYLLALLGFSKCLGAWMLSLQHNVGTLGMSMSKQPYALTCLITFCK